MNENNNQANGNQGNKGKTLGSGKETGNSKTFKLKPTKTLMVS